MPDGGETIGEAEARAAGYLEGVAAGRRLGWVAGAEAMRERAAALVESEWRGDVAARAIRALPVPKGEP